MTEQRFDYLEQRVKALEALTRGLDARVARLEPKPFAAPPVQQAYPPPPRFEIPAPVVEGQVVPPKDTEYQLGAQWLPRIGAFLLVLGIAYMVGLAVTKGWITPPMLFGGAVALCLGFIGVGFWLREEKEDFGQVLMGIGSCGLFATIAGGHFYQHLYTGEQMLYGFLGWSFLNLTYAFIRASRAFLGIGIIGGLLSAVMPITQSDFVSSIGLHAVIIVLASAVIVRHKFSRAALGLWIGSGLTMMPVWFEESLPWATKVVAMYGFSLLALLAYLLGREKANEHEDPLAVGIMATLPALCAFGIRDGIDGVVHTLIAASVCGLLALGFRKEVAVRNAFVYSAIGIATLLAPFGFEMKTTALVLAGLSIVTSIVAALNKRPNWATLSLCQLLVAGGAYLATFTGSPSFAPVQNEPAILGALLAASVALAAAIGKLQDDPRLLVAFFGGWAIVSRLGSILFALPNDLRLASFSVTIAWVVFGCALLATGFLANLRNYRYAALAVLLAGVAKVLAIDLSTVTPELRVAALIGVGLALVGGGYAYVRKRGLVR